MSGGTRLFGRTAAAAPQKAAKSAPVPVRKLASKAKAAATPPLKPAFGLFGTRSTAAGPTGDAAALLEALPEPLPDYHSHMHSSGLWQC